jgi:hypothetical protein
MCRGPESPVESSGGSASSLLYRRLLTRGSGFPSVAKWVSLPILEGSSVAYGSARAVVAGNIGARQLAPIDQ